MHIATNNILFIDLNRKPDDISYIGLIKFLNSHNNINVQKLNSIDEFKKKVIDIDYEVDILIAWLDYDSAHFWRDFIEQSDDTKTIVVFGFEDGVQQHIHEVMRSGAYAFACPFNQSVLNAYIEALALESKMNVAINNLRDCLSISTNLNDQIQILLNELKSNQMIGYDRATISLVDRDNSRYLLLHDPARTKPDRHLLINIEKDKLIQNVIDKGILILDVAGMRESAGALDDIGWEDNGATQDINSWIGIALRSYNRVIAIITLDSQHKGIYQHFSENIWQFLDKFRFIAGEMIDSLMQSSNKDVLDDIIANIGDDLHSEELVREILIKIKKALKCDNCTFFRTYSSHDSNGTFVSKWVGANDKLKSNIYNKKVRIFRKREGLAGYVLDDGKSRIIPHALEAREFQPTPRLSGTSLSMLVIPVLSSASTRNQIVGVISCYKVEHTDYFTTYDRDLIEQVALHTSSTIERTMVLEYSDKISKEINNLNNALGEENNKSTLLRKICEYALNVTGSNEAVIHRLQRVANEDLRPIYRSTGESYHFPEELKPMPPRLDGNGVTDIVLQEGVIVQFSEDEGNFDFVSDDLKLQGVKHITGVPLIVGEKEKSEIIGVLYLSKYSGDKLSKIDEFSLELFASQAANAIRNQEFLRERQTWTDAHTGLADSIEVVTRSFDQSEIELTLRDIILQAHKLVNASFSYLALRIGGNNFEFRTAWPEWILAELMTEVRMFNPETGNPKFQGKKGITGLTAEIGDMILIQDIQEEERKQSDKWKHYIQFRKETRSELAVPIRRDPDGEIIGVINLEHKEPYAFTDVHCRVIKLFARQVAIAFQKSELLDKIRSQHHIMRNLQNSIQEIASSPPNEMLNRAVSLTSYALNAKFVMVIPITRKENSIIISEDDIVANSSRYQSIKRDIARDDKIAIDVFEDQKPFFSSDVLADRKLSEEFQKNPLLRDHAGSALCTPLVTQKGCIGVMWILFNDIHSDKVFFLEDANIFQAYANQIALAYANARRSEELFERLKNAQTDITNRIQLHYEDTRFQSRMYYVLSLLGTFFGFFAAATTVFMLFNNQITDQTTTVLTAVFAIVVEIGSVFIFSRANAANERMDRYHRELFKIRQFNILLLASEQLERHEEESKKLLIEGAAQNWFTSTSE